MVKRCPICGETDITQFGNDRSRADQLTVYCKKCRKGKNKADWQRHQEQYTAASRARYGQNKEQVLAWHKRYYQSHREERRAYSREYNRTHRAEVAARQRAYVERNRARINAYRREREKTWRQTPGRQAYFRAWQRRHPEKIRHYRKLQRERLQGKVDTSS